jgi:hypothetical protein
MGAPKLLLVGVLALVLFAVPCLSLSRIACNNVKQGMDVQGPYSSAIILLWIILVRWYSLPECA